MKRYKRIALIGLTALTVVASSVACDDTTTPSAAEACKVACAIAHPYGSEGWREGYTSCVDVCKTLP